MAQEMPKKGRASNEGSSRISCDRRRRRTAPTGGWWLHRFVGLLLQVSFDGREAFITHPLAKITRNGSKQFSFAAPVFLTSPFDKRIKIGLQPCDLGHFEATSPQLVFNFVDLGN
jgi:hypothetical protein